MDCSPPGSSVPGILQARTLEWVAISFSNAWKWKVKVKSLSRVWLLATPWTAAYQALPSMGFSGQQYWSGVPLPSPGDLPDSETDIMPSVLAGRFFTTEPPGKPHLGYFYETYLKYWRISMWVPLIVSKCRYNKPLYLHGAKHSSVLFLRLMTFYVHTAVYNSTCICYVISHSTRTTTLQMEMLVNVPKVT